MEPREIGSVTEIGVEDIVFRYHRSGNPAQEALMLKELMSKGMTQSGLAKLLEVTQAHISRRLKLLDLLPELFDSVLKGDIRARTGYMLARLPRENQAAFLGRDKITMKESEEAVRSFVLNEDVINLVKNDVANKAEESVLELQTLVDKLNDPQLKILRTLIDERLQNI